MRGNREEQKRNQGTDVAPLAFFCRSFFCPTVELIATALVLRRAHLGFRRLRHTHCVRATRDSFCVIRVDSRPFAVSKSRCWVPAVPACAGMTGWGGVPVGFRDDRCFTDGREGESAIH